MVCLETLNCSSVAVSPDSCLRYGQVSGKLKAQSMRHEPGPGASRRDATRTDSSFRVVATSRLVAPTEFDSRLHPFSRGSTCRPDRARHQTPPRRLRIRLVDPSDSWVAPCRSDKVRLVRRRVPSDRARHVRLLRLREACRATRPASGPTRPTTSPVGSGSTRATPQTPRALGGDETTGPTGGCV